MNWLRWTAHRRRREAERRLHADLATTMAELVANLRRERDQRQAAGQETAAMEQFLHGLGVEEYLRYAA